ncbi:hypothetical protein SAMN06297144_2696 [Sphingomonas guangdongensis]|uniref:Uncharacterized protein n=1 Tax=Sphingomonas guangdongensis TaxID=1141890 RepID=A0A285R166_9SPHN|nr:hypothetical protein [Sphingomonas guangdongensis]SOB87564.1 hypothetical protein SAMN06297144_2696 [Sphingomonas guangdongensis]
MATDPNSGGTTPADVDFTPDAGVAATFEPGDALVADAGATGAGTTESADAAKPATTRQLVKDEASKLGGQATDRLRAFADDGKSRATGALGELAKAIEDAAGTIDEKVGAQFGDYARAASSQVTGLADSLNNKDVEELLDGARELIRKSPGIAVGTAAALGFVVARLLRSGVDANREA